MSSEITGQITVELAAHSSFELDNGAAALVIPNPSAQANEPEFTICWPTDLNPGAACSSAAETFPLITAGKKDAVLVLRNGDSSGWEHWQAPCAFLGQVPVRNLSCATFHDYEHVLGFGWMRGLPDDLGQPVFTYAFRRPLDEAHLGRLIEITGTSELIDRLDEVIEWVQGIITAP